MEGKLVKYRGYIALYSYLVLYGVKPQHLHFAAVGFDDAKQGVYRSGLAGTVLPDKAHNAAFRDGEVDIVEREAVEVLGKTFYLDSIFICCHSNSSLSEPGSSLTIVDNIDKLVYLFGSNAAGTGFVTRLSDELFGLTEVFLPDELAVLPLDEAAFAGLGDDKSVAFELFVGAFCSNDADSQRLSKCAHRREGVPFRELTAHYLSLDL